MKIRRVRASDLEAVTRIYNHYVRETPVTFDIEPVEVEARRPWLLQFAERGRYQCFVAEDDGNVVGYAGSVRFRAKAAYDTSVETTIYLAPAARRKGLGRSLYEDLLGSLAKEDIRRILAGITLPNDASIALHERFGFERVGVFREVGRKFGRYWDVLWMERAQG